MIDKTLYDKAMTGICFGTVTDVDADRRLCSVQTFGGSGLTDCYVNQCQWLSVDANPTGDESTSVPRVGSICVMGFVDGEAFIIGFFRGLDGANGASAANTYPAVQGDKVFSTIGGNRLVLKRSGLIELYVKETLKRIYMPTDSKIIDICRNYEFKADGGFKKWTTDTEVGTTVFTAEYRQDLTRLNVVFDEIGQAGGTTIVRRSIGPAVPGVEGVALPNYKCETDITGKTTLNISPAGIAGVNASIDPTGDIALTVGLPSLPQFSLTIGADGTTEIAVNSVVTITVDPAGAIDAVNKGGSLALSEIGALEVKNNLGSFTMSEAGKFSLKGAAAELLDLFDQFLQQQISILTAIQALSVGTGTGPSSPPINIADFAKAMSSVVQIKTMLATLKG